MWRRRRWFAISGVSLGANCLRKGLFAFGPTRRSLRQFVPAAEYLEPIWRWLSSTGPRQLRISNHIEGHSPGYFRLSDRATRGLALLAGSRSLRA